jgi:hypothetical protein
MLSVDKDAAIKFFDSAENVFLRFGSTRGLGLGMELTALTVSGWLNPAVSLWCVVLGFIAFALTLLSFHQKPHIDRRAVDTSPKSGEPGVQP